MTFSFIYFYLFSKNSVQSLSPVRLFVTPRTAGPQAFLSLTIAPSLPEFMSLEPVMLLYPYRWICIYIHIYISVYDFMYALLLVTKISDWKSAALPLWMKNCPSPSAFTRMKSLAAAVTGLNTLQKEFRAGIRNEALCALGKTGRTDLQIVRYFQENTFMSQISCIFSYLEKH